MKLSNGSLCRIPIFVSDACARIMDQIEVEGIFRKAGSQLRQKEIRVNMIFVNSTEILVKHITDGQLSQFYIQGKA